MDGPTAGLRRDLKPKFPTNTHIYATLPTNSRERAPATSGTLLIKRNSSDGSLSLQEAVRDPATNSSRCGGKRREEEEVSSL